MMTFVMADLGPSIVETIPEFVVIVVVAIGAVAFRSELKSWLKSATKLKLFGFEIERAAADLKEAAKEDHVPTDAAARRAVERLAGAAPRLCGMEILWVDDHPEGNRELRKLIAEHGPRFVLSSSNAAARIELKRKDFDLVITDIGRDAEPFDDALDRAQTGLDLALEIVNSPAPPPVIVFAGDVEEVDVSPSSAASQQMRRSSCISSSTWRNGDDPAAVPHGFAGRSHGWSGSSSS